MRVFELTPPNLGRYIWVADVTCEDYTCCSYLRGFIAEELALSKSKSTETIGHGADLHPSLVFLVYIKYALVPVHEERHVYISDLELEHFQNWLFKCDKNLPLDGELLCLLDELDHCWVRRGHRLFDLRSDEKSSDW